MMSQPRGSSSAMWSSPSHGRLALALRPAWAIWMPGTAPPSLISRTASFHASACASDQIPAQPGVIRPSGETAVASAITSPAPPRASPARWLRCQSLMSPSSATYWHIGDTTMRLRSVTSFS